MQYNTLRDTLRTDMFVLITACQELHQTKCVISGDGRYWQCMRVKFHFWPTQCIL